MEKSRVRRPRRYLRSRITRKLILETALKLFLADGYKKTTITMISKQANVGYGTVYSHFKGKDDLLIKILDGFFDVFNTLLLVPPTFSGYQEAWDNYRELVKTFLNLAEKHRPLMMALHEALEHSEPIVEYWDNIKNNFIKSIAGIIQQAQQQKMAKPDFDPVKAAKINVLLLECCFWEVVRENETDIQYLGTFITNMIYEGLFIKSP